MRSILANILLFVMLGTCHGKLYAQVPQKSSYQAVIRDMDNKLVVDSPVGIRINILKETYDGEAVYTETHQVNTNANGLLTLEIGTGFVEYGQFDTIKWAQGPYFLKSEVDPGGGFNYSVSGTHEILSVPYALHAVTADSILGIRQMVDSLMQKYPAINISITDINKWRSLIDTASGNETDFDGWDKNVADDFSGNYNDLSNTPKNLSDFNNDIEFISSETDPDYNTSVAATITNDDIDRWNTNSEETDPVYNSSVAAGITSADTALWNTYVSESDPVFAAWDKRSGISIAQSQITDLAVFEKELTAGETSIDVGFALLSTSNIYLNGNVLTSAQWSGVGTNTIVLDLDIELFDKLKIER